MEENKYYQIYTESNLNLAGSLVIKSDAAARGVNQMVYANALASYDELDPRTWKYYLNICGNYYPSDEAMYLTSMDTLEQVMFSKETLVFHRATARAYAFGTTYYKELVARYPHQEQLIRGILYPADMEKAIAARDGEILSYPPELIENTEPTFLVMLQEWIYGYFARWHNVQYTNLDNLYNAAMLGVMYSMLPGAIENIRLRLCRTSEAHSYHVREYLSCNSNIGRYLPYMTRSQAMYFYRNIKYIQAHAGTNAMLDELIEKCMTDRKLPIASFSMQHNTEDMPGVLDPLVMFYKKPINTPGNIDNRYLFNLGQVLDIQEPMAPGNKKYRDELQAEALVRTTQTLNPVVPTKLLQSTVVDYTDSEKFRMADIVLNHWLWLSSAEAYKAFVTVTIPANGSTISLSAKDAFIFYAYAMVKGYGYEMDKLPRVVANRVQHLKRASLENLQAVVPASMKNDPRLQAFRTSLDVPGSLISLDAFRRHCEQLFLAANNNYYVIAKEEYMSTRGYLEAASARLWCDAYIDLAEYEGQTYADWFEARNLLVSEYTKEQLAEIGAVILKEAVGANLASSITLKDIQNAMCSIILRLSSYSIQLDKNINTGPVIDAGQTQVRIDDNIKQTGKGLHFVEIPQLDYENVVTRGKHRSFIPANSLVKYKVNSTSPSDKRKLHLPHVKYRFAPGGVKSHYRMSLGVGPSVRIGALPENPRGLTIVSGMEKFLGLTLEQQLGSYVDAWRVRK